MSGLCICVWTKRAPSTGCGTVGPQLLMHVHLRCMCTRVFPPQAQKGAEGGTSTCKLCLGSRMWRRFGIKRTDNFRFTSFCMNVLGRAWIIYNLYPDLGVQKDSAMQAQQIVSTVCPWDDCPHYIPVTLDWVVFLPQEMLRWSSSHPWKPHHILTTKRTLAHIVQLWSRLLPLWYAGCIPRSPSDFIFPFDIMFQRKNSKKLNL